MKKNEESLEYLKMTNVLCLQWIEKELKKPFKPDEIEYRITATSKDKGLAVAYIQNRAIQNRLDEVMGFNNWKNEFSVIDKGKICGLSLRINEEWITKYDGASDTNIASTKGGISDSMKRAAVQWGIGRYLYKLPSQWVKIDEKGKILERPKLPNWALPDEMQHKEIDFEEINKGKKPVIQKNKLSDNIDNCIKAFEKIGVRKADLENYLCLEAETFTKKDIETLRTVYLQLYNGQKKKEDFFYTPETKKGQQTLKLEKLLEGEK